MSEKKTYKICIVGNSFARGGAEKAHAVLANSLNDLGLEIHNIIFENTKIEYNFSGSLFVLDFKPKMSYFEKLKKILLLKKYIKKQKFDYIIDFRYRGTWYTEWILVKYIFNAASYIPRIASFNTELYFTTNNFIAKRIYKKAFFINSLSKEMEEKIRKKYNYNNIKTIYNSIELDKIRTLSEESVQMNFNYIVAVGRMAKDNVKQHDVMIEAYQKSVLPEKNIKLVFVGDGEKRMEFESIVSQKNLSDKIIFTGFQSNPFKYLKNACFMLLASKYEGFPNVVLESFACQTPVISYDCKSGPKEIIQNHQNGILVENQNIDELVKSINLFVENQELYKFCKSNSLKTAEKYSNKNIAKQWLDAMKII